ncbi:MAG: hypothetical protein EOO03_14100 [Chitinophagaceae bacterium]|nr:MAG: hypothetical protein EOO03_14100 [Chitinophagaceae bacterium]
MNTRQNPSGFTKWDAAPGGTQSISDRTNGALNTGLDKQKLDWYFTPFVKVRAGLNMHVTQDLFSFVSTVSALDAPAGTPVNNVFIFPSTGINGTASAKYVAQEKFVVGSINYYNKNHTDFTARNAKWMYNEMEDIAHDLGCLQAADCFSPVLPVHYNQTNCNEATISTTANAATYTWRCTAIS